MLKDYYKDKKRIFNEQLISLSEEIEGVELINNIADTSYDTNNQVLVEAVNLLKKEDKEFINLYYLSGQVLSQKEVAEKLGITQQAVSKKFTRIKKKVNEGR